MAAADGSTPRLPRRPARRRRAAASTPRCAAPRQHADLRRARRAGAARSSAACRALGLRPRRPGDAGDVRRRPDAGRDPRRVPRRRRRRAGLDDAHRRRARQDPGRLRGADGACAPRSSPTAVVERARRSRPTSSTWSLAGDRDASAAPDGVAMHVVGRRSSPPGAATGDSPAAAAPTTTPGRCGSTPRGTTGHAQGRDAPARQHPPRLRDLRPPGARHHRRRRRPSRWPSCSSPTASATRCSSRSRSAPRPSSSRGGPRPTWCRSGSRRAAHAVLRRPDLLRRAARQRHRRTTPSPRCGWPRRRARRCRRRCCAGSPSGSASTSSTASAPPRRCTSSCPTAPGDIRPGTTGRAVPGYDVVVRDEDGRRSPPPASPGALYVRGESIALGYWRRTEATAAGLPRRVAGHRRHLRARRRRLLHLPGPQHRHAQGRRHLGLARRGREPAARAPGGARGRRRRGGRRRRARQAGGRRSWPTRRATRPRWSPGAATALAHFKAPRHVVFVDDLPKTATGKLQRFKVRALLVAAERPRTSAVRNALLRAARPPPEESSRALRDRQRLHRRQRQGVRRRVPRGLHLRGRAARATSTPRSASTAAPASRCARSRRSARTAGWPTATRRSSRTTRTFFTELAARSRRAARAHPGGASKVGDLGRRHRAGRRMGGPDARRPPPGRRPRATSRCSGSLKPAWIQWARDFGPDGILERLWDAEGRPARPSSTSCSRSRASTRRCCSASTAPRPPATSASTTCCRSSSTTPAVPAGRQRQPAPALPDRSRGHPPARPRRRRAQAAPGARRLPLRRPRALPGVRRARRARRPARRALRHLAPSRAR